MLPVLRRELVAHRARRAGKNLRLVRPDSLAFLTARGKPQSRRNALRALHKGRRRGRSEPGRRRAGRPSRPAPVARRAFARTGSDAPRGRRASATCEREGHPRDVRRTDEGRPRRRGGEAPRKRLRKVKRRKSVSAMSAANVRSGSVVANDTNPNRAISREKRTGANGSERLLCLDKLGVTGSSPVPPRASASNR
jgi:hypothetical protein